MPSARKLAEFMQSYEGFSQVMIRPVGWVRRLSNTRWPSRVGQAMVEISWVGSGRVTRLSKSHGSGQVRSGHPYSIPTRENQYDP